MAIEASYERHVDTLLDLTDEVSGCRLMVLKITADGVIDPNERPAFDAAFGRITTKTRRALIDAQHLAAAFRLLRTLIYSGPTAWVRRVARETERDLAELETAHP